MNSIHQFASQEPQPFTAWLERAKRCFVGATIHGGGRYAVAVMNHVDVFLYETQAESAAHLAQDSKYKFYDLETFVPPRIPCRTIPEPFDVDEMRRERREKR